jgi:hypothetical protein
MTSPSGMGTGLSVLSHSPLKAFTSQSLNSAAVISKCGFHGRTRGVLTLVNDAIGIVEVDAMVAVWEHMHIIVGNASLIQLVEQLQGVLEVHVVVAVAMHDQEFDILTESSHVADGRIVVTAGVVLRGVHVSLRIHGIVEAPIGDWCDGHAVLEGLSSIHLKSLECHEAAV